MVGDKADAQVEAEQRLGDDDERHRPPGGEDEEWRDEEDASVHGQQRGLEERGPVPTPGERHNAGHVQVQGLEKHQWQQ